VRPEPRVSILTSGIGLGIYIPALLIQRQMAALGLRAEVEVLEEYYEPDAQRRHVEHKQAYHENFALALMAHRMARGIEQHLDEARIGELLRRWAGEARTCFIVWSGFWLPILERYRALAGTPLSVDCCRIDAEVSASFRVHADLFRDATEVWLWSWAQKKTLHELPASHEPPLPFAAREHRLVVHGGGWGLGSYRDRVAELDGTRWGCDVVAHAPAEATRNRHADRYFMVDPGWRPWHRSDGAHTFPPFGELGGAPAADAATDGHALFERIRNSKAIISKPGGGTLIDSLSAATPLVLLEPYGYAEASNAALWQHLGFAIPYERWRDSGYDESVLEALHQNLVGRVRNGPDYPRAYVERIARGARA
jgi:hypothetical protein